MRSPDQAAFKAILIVTFVTAIAMLPFAAMAEPNTPKGPSALFELDVDADGYVSEDEFNAGQEKRQAEMAAAGKPAKAENAPSFADFDADGDGQLTQDELVAGQKAHRQAMRAQKAASDPGQNQGKGRKMATFTDLDVNEDGCIDADEFAQHQAKRQGKQEQPESE